MATVHIHTEFQTQNSKVTGSNPAPTKDAFEDIAFSRAFFISSDGGLDKLANYWQTI